MEESKQKLGGDECHLCGGCGEVAFVPAGDPECRQDVFGCPGCIQAERDQLQAELNALKEMQANTRLIAEDQRDKLLWALELLLCEVEEAEYMTGREREAEARAVIAQVKGGGA